VEKNECDFYFKNKKKGKLQSRCKQCQSKYHRSHYESNKKTYFERAKNNNPKYKKRNKNFVSEYKSNIGCKFCNEKTPVCLDFHHKDPTIKDWNISIMSNSASSLDTIKKEIDKCIVICSNCHRKLHAGLLDLNK